MFILSNVHRLAKNILITCPIYEGLLKCALSMLLGIANDGSVQALGLQLPDGGNNG